MAEQTGQIQAAIKNIAPRNAGDDPDARAEALRDHWWVQCEKEGTWQDYDSARAGSEPGQTIVQAKKTCQPDEIAKEQVHSVAVKVLIEQWKGGSLKEKPVLHHVLNASESFGQRIVLRHIQMNWPEDYNYGGHGRSCHTAEIRRSGRKEMAARSNRGHRHGCPIELHLIRRRR